MAVYHPIVVSANGSKSIGVAIINNIAFLIVNGDVHIAVVAGHIYTLCRVQCKRNCAVCACRHQRVECVAQLCNHLYGFC